MVGRRLGDQCRRRHARHEAEQERDSSSASRTRLVLGQPKTPKSCRTLALTPEPMARLRQHCARQAQAKMSMGVLAGTITGMVFATELGTPIDSDNFSHAFSALCERAGLGHWRRMSCATPGLR